MQDATPTGHAGAARCSTADVEPVLRVGTSVGRRSARRGRCAWPYSSRSLHRPVDCGYSSPEDAVKPSRPASCPRTRLVVAAAITIAAVASRVCTSPTGGLAIALLVAIQRSLLHRRRRARSTPRYGGGASRAVLTISTLQGRVVRHSVGTLPRTRRRPCMHCDNTIRSAWSGGDVQRTSPGMQKRAVGIVRVRTPAWKSRTLGEGVPSSV